MKIISFKSIIKVSICRTILYTILGFLILSCNTKRDKTNIGFEVYSNLEKVVDSKFVTSNKEIELIGGINISDKEAFSGQHSLLTHKNAPFGLEFRVNELMPDQYYYISVWCKGDTEHATIVADGVNDVFYKAQRLPIADSNGWKKVELQFHIPRIVNFKQLGIYIWNNGGDTIYFDDFYVKSSPERIYPEYEEPALEILIDSSDLVKLDKIRVSAFKAGILETKENSYVKAKFIYNDDTLKGELRFKGDYLEHIMGDKWSFRIKLKNKYSWKGMNTFSIHTPIARGFLDEKLLHDFLRGNDILATRYGIVPVYLNGRSLGVYAYEEHFRKELVESLNRREGIIIKPTEDEFWLSYRLVESGKIKSNIPYFKASAIVPFQEKKILESNVVYNRFEIAQDLLYQFQYAIKPASEIFDVEKMAKYMAILDIMGGYHGTHWHNLRFYYNPVLARLEPIAFDNFPGVGKPDSLFFGKYFFSGNYMFKESSGMISLLKDKNFVEQYLTDLEYYLENFPQFVQEYRKISEKYEPMIKAEFPYYHFEEYYIDRIAKMKNSLDEYKKWIENKILKSDLTFHDESENNYQYDKEFPEFLVKVYSEMNDANAVNLRIFNHSNLKIKVTSILLKKDSIDLIDENVYIEEGESYILKTDVQSLGVIKSLKFIVEKHKNDIFEATVFPWSFPKDETSLQKFEKNAEQNFKKYASIYGKQIVFAGKTIKIDKTVFIPKGYEVVIKEGTNIDIINNAAFISYSPVKIIGKPNNKITIKSSDGTARGFTIIQPKGICKLEYVVFDQLNTLNFPGWELTGAVNFYEAKIEMNHVWFTNNRSEDALNTIRSEFKIDNCHFDNIFADAFDSDFSNGELENSTFIDTGNDAIDFSGSKVLIKNCKIINPSDKAISGGEASDLIIENTSVINANIAVASKDNSNVFIDGIDVDNCNYGFIVFTKKPVYGPAMITLNNYVINRCRIPYLIEIGSSLLIDNKLKLGNEKEVANLFY